MPGQKDFKEAFKELREIQARYKEIFEGSRDGFVIVNSSGQIINANKAYCDMLGYSLEELKQLENFYEITPEKWREWERCEIWEKRLLKQGYTGLYEKEYIRKDGTVFPVELQSYSVKNDAGEIEYLWGTARDISERKQTEEELRKSEAIVRNKLKAIIEPEGDIGTLNLADIIDVEELQTMMENLYIATNIGGAILDIAGNILASVGWQDICTKFHRVHPDTEKNCLESDLALASGVPAGTFKAYRCKNNMWDMVSPIEVGGKHLGNIYIGQFFFEDEHIDYELYRKQARQHGFDESEYLAALDRVPRLKKEKVNSVMSFYANFAEMLSSLSYSKIMLSRDNVQRKQAEKALKEKKDLLQRVFDSNLDLIALADLEGNFTLVGKSHEILGYDNDYLIGKNVMEFVHPEDVDIVHKEFSRFLQSGENRKVKYRYRRIDGEYLWFETVGTFLRDEKGGPEQILFNTRNITERKRAEENLKLKHNLLIFLMEVTGTHFNIIDTKYNIRDVDLAWQETYGDFKGRKCHEYFMGLKKPCPSCGLPKAFETKDIVVTEEFLPDENKYYEVHTIPFKNNQGEWLCSEFNIDITERKQSEETLKSNYALLHIAGETARFGGWSVDLEKNIATWSDAVADIHEVPHGYAPSVETGINFYAPEWHDKITQVFNDCARKGIPYDEEMEIITSKGKRLWVRTNGRAVRDENGKIIKVQGSFQDISEWKQAEKALKQREEHYRLLVNNMYEGIMQTTLDDEILFVNPRLCEMLGYREEELIGKTGYEVLLFEEDRQTAIEKNNLRTKKISDRYIIKLRRKDGSAVWTQISGSPVYDNNGKVTGTIGLITDITQLKETQKALIDSEERFKKLSSLTFEGITIHNNGICIDVNDSFCRLLGYERDEIIGKNLITAVVREDYHKLVKEKIVQFYAKPYEIIGIKKDGSEFPAEIVARDINWKGETIRVAAVRDVTERKQYELEIIAAKQKAEESDRLKSAFLANMSHEIRSPMNSIVGFANILKEPDLSHDERKEYVEIINGSSRQLLSLINDVIDISKIESGIFSLEKSRFSLAKVLSEIQKEFSLEAQKKNLDLKLNIDTSLKETDILADLTRFKQIFHNLIGNALKFTYEGFVEFGCNICNEGLCFYVKDSGIGISKDNFEIIFDRFRQIEDSSTRSFGGTGLGLAITKALVEKMDGSITVESTAGKGSVFSFVLPSSTTVKNETKKAESKSKSAGDLQKTKIKILIAEDEQTNYLLLKKIFAGDNYLLTRASNGAEAVELFKKEPFDIIIMDIKMPVMNGYEAAKRIREIDKDIPIVALTAYAMSGDREKALRAGCTDYISKPCYKDIVIKKVNNLMKQQ